MVSTHQQDSGFRLIFLRVVADFKRPDIAAFKAFAYRLEPTDIFVIFRPAGKFVGNGLICMIGKIFILGLLYLLNVFVKIFDQNFNRVFFCK